MDQHEDQTEEFEEVEDAAAPEPESIEDSIRAAMDGDDEAQTDENIPGSEGEKPEEPTLSASEAARILAKSKGQKGKKRQTYEASELEGATSEAPEGEAENEENYEPPVRLSVEDKQAFLKLPKLGQKAVSEAVRNLEGHYTKKLQEVAPLHQKYSGLAEVEQTYKPHLDRHGLDFPSGTRQLWAAHHALTTDPDNELLRLIEKSGRSLESLYRHRQGIGGQPHAPSMRQENYPQASQHYLTQDQVEQIIAARLQGHSQAQTQHADVQAFENLRNERDPSGAYLYPELWDNAAHDANYWNMGTLHRVKPLVESLRMTQPGISVSEATKRAIQTLRLLNGNGSLNPGQGSRLPTNSQESIARARAASSASIRGRGNGTIPTVAEAKAGESIEDSIRAVQNMNRQH